jgi:hypothetical protein
MLWSEFLNIERCDLTCEYIRLFRRKARVNEVLGAQWCGQKTIFTAIILDSKCRIRSLRLSDPDPHMASHDGVGLGCGPMS